MGAPSRLLKRLGILEPRDRLVRVKSWLPWWDGAYVCWPTLLVDHLGYQRMTVAPCWTWRGRARGPA